MAAFSNPIQGVSMSLALREAATYAPIERVVLATYEFIHSTFASRALVVCNYEDITAKDEAGVTVTYVAIGGLRTSGFEESDQAATPTLKLELDGVSGQLISALDLALTTLEPVYVIERIYVSDDLSTPALLPPAKAVVRSADVSEVRVSLEVGFGDPANQPFPRKVFTRKEHPGLAA